MRKNENYFVELRIFFPSVCGKKMVGGRRKNSQNDENTLVIIVIYILSFQIY